MKPNGNVPGSPFDFDAIPVWIFPSLWDETKIVRFRGLWFVLLYTMSVLIYSALFMTVIGLIFSRPTSLVLWFSQYIGLPTGVIYGFATWMDFIRQRKKLLLENAPPNSDVRSQANQK